MKNLSVSKKLFWAMHAFGLAMGMIFPVYASFFVQYNDGMQLYFVIGCLLAGYFVGAFSFLMVKMIVFKILTQLTNELVKTADGELRDDFVLDSDDAFGALATAYNKIQESLREMSQSTGDYIANIGAGKLQSKPQLGGLKGAYAEIMQKVSRAFERTISFIDRMPNGFITLDHAQEIQYINKKGRELVAQQTGRISKLDFNTVLEMGESTSDEADLNKVAGENTKVQVIGQPIVGDLGRAIGVAVTLTDISTVSKMISELKISRQESEEKRVVIEKMMAYQKNEVNKISIVLKKVADSILDVRYISADGDETTVDLQNLFKTVSADLNRVVDNFSKIIGGLNSSVASISSATGFIESSCENLQAVSNTQSESIGTLIRQVNSSVENSNLLKKQSDETERLINEYHLDAEQGAQKMNQLIQIMDAISNSSNEIKDIIRLIDELSFQTNLLALNAAVEAARAGEHGRGFAVVAEEVRSLANRSASAANKIGDLLSGTVERIDEGKVKSYETQDVLEQTIKNIEKVSGFINELTKESAQQTNLSFELKTELAQIVEDIQRNSVTIEKVSAQAGDLNNLSQKLESMIEQIEIRRETADLGNRRFLTN